MIASLQRWLTLGALLFALLAATATWRAGHPIGALIVALAVLTLHAQVLAVEMLLMRVANRHDAAAPEPLGALLRAWISESLHGPLVFCWRQPFQSKRYPDLLSAGRARGVLLVHGFVCNRGLWNPWLRRLSSHRCSFVAINLEPPFGSIEDYRSIIEQGIRQLESVTGVPPVVVAHSMGGLAVRRWWREPGNAGRVHHLITLGTPHRGTWLARFALSANARQMRLNSAWLANLNAPGTAALAHRTTCFYSATDNIVFPASTAAWPGADNRRLTGGVPHVAMVDHPGPWQLLLQLLARG